MNSLGHMMSIIHSNSLTVDCARDDKEQYIMNINIIIIAMTKYVIWISYRRLLN